VLINIRGNKVVFYKNGHKASPKHELDLVGVLPEELYYPTVTMYHGEDRVRWVDDISINFNVFYKLITEVSEDLKKVAKERVIKAAQQASDKEKNGTCCIL
jgi:hypothetical protein